MVGHNAEGATLHKSITDRKSCANLCISTPECVAFDYDYNDPPYKGANCWIHDNPNLKIKTQPHVDHYTRDVCQKDSSKL